MWLVVSAVEMELRGISGVPVGVGPLESAVCATRLILQKSPDAVLFVGSAGQFHDGVPVGSAVVSRRLGWASGVEAMGHGYVPRPPPVLETPEWMRTLSAVPEADVLTVGAISTAPELVRSFGATWQVEHMEAWSVARAAAECGVPFAAVLGISNRVGPDAHQEWLRHREAAELAAVEVARRMIGSGIPPKMG